MIHHNSNLALRFYSPICAIVFLFLNILFSAAASAEISPIQMSKNLNGQTLIGHAEFFAEDRLIKHPEYIQNAQRWTDLKTSNIELGLSEAPYWIRFQLNNPVDSTRAIILTHELAYLDDLAMFYRSQNNWVVQNLSSRKPFHTREIKSPKLAAKITLEGHESSIVYVRISNRHVEHNNLSFSLWTEDEFERKQNLHLFKTALFSGFALSLGLVWSIFALVLKQPRFAAYAVFMASAGIFYSAFSGVGFQLIYPNHPEIHERLYMLALQCGAGFSFLFTKLHLEPGKKGFIWIDNTLILLFSIAMLMVLLTLLSWNIVLSIASSMILSGTSLFNAVVGIIIWRKFKEEFAFWFMLGWVLVGLLMFSLMLIFSLGMGNHLLSPETSHAVGQVVISIDGLLLSISLARWVQSEQKLKEHAENAALTDPLTSLMNRRALEQEMTMLFSLPKQQRSIWLAILDIDKFKAINDTYGHQAGDLVIKTCANVIKDNIREQDMAFRIGGEEFAIVFSQCSQHDVEALVNRLRVAFTAPTKFAETNIQHTLSAGVASNKTEQEPSFSSIFKQADKALYLAKNNGRNRVELALGT